MAEPADKKLTQENPAEDLAHLADLEHVRLRPRMYVGDTGKDGLHQLVYHLVHHSQRGFVTEVVTTIEVTIHSGGAVTVEDDTFGLTVVMNERFALTSLQRSMTHMAYGFREREWRPYWACSGLPIESVLTFAPNALSSHCTAEVIQQDGIAFRQSYRQGVPVTDVESYETSETHGLRITIQPDPYIFPDTNFDPDRIRQHLQQVARDNPGLQLNFTDERTGEQQSFQYNT